MAPNSQVRGKAYMYISKNVKLDKLKEIYTHINKQKNKHITDKSQKPIE